MARGSKGGLLGRAGAVEKADQRRWLHEEAMREADAARLKREAEEITKENDLIRLCIAADGERVFFKWWDDDEQVSPHGRRSERIALLEKRLGLLHEDSVQAESGSV